MGHARGAFMAVKVKRWMKKKALIIIIIRIIISVKHNAFAILNNIIISDT